jgi:gamma-glutamyltranspeptidase/glutathione hydrolase
MTPTIIVQGDQLKMVIGGPGGATIITTVYQAILNVLEHGMTMQDAVEAAKVHHQWLPDQLTLEEGKMPVAVVKKLERMGYKIAYRKFLGRLAAILITDEGLEAGADPRGDNYGKGY